MYIVSKYVILVDPIFLKEQNFYQNHKSKISCVAIHPNKQIIASAEASISSSIHVWLATNCMVLNTIKSYHKSGVFSMNFSKKKYYIISIGVDKQKSLQIADWITGEVLAFRFTVCNKLLDL